jgi:hypothetical protein
MSASPHNIILSTRRIKNVPSSRGKYVRSECCHATRQPRSQATSISTGRCSSSLKKVLTSAANWGKLACGVLISLGTCRAGATELELLVGDFLLSGGSASTRDGILGDVRLAVLEAGLL